MGLRAIHHSPLLLIIAVNQPVVHPHVFIKVGHGKQYQPGSTGGCCRPNCEAPDAACTHALSTISICVQLDQQCL